MPNELSFLRPPGPPTSAADDLRYWATHPLAGADPRRTAPALNRAAVHTLRLLGWLAALGAVLTGVAIVMPTLATAAADYPLDLLSLMGAGAAVAAALSGVARGVAGGRRWARAAGLACGTLVLLGFPVGTLAGCHVWWRLLFRWQRAPPEPPG